MLDCLQLLHFHSGSQITSIREVKEVMRESSFLFAELVKVRVVLVLFCFVCCFCGLGFRVVVGGGGVFMCCCVLLLWLVVLLVVLFFGGGVVVVVGAVAGRGLSFLMSSCIFTETRVPRPPSTVANDARASAARRGAGPSQKKPTGKLETLSFSLSLIVNAQHTALQKQDGRQHALHRRRRRPRRRLRRLLHRHARVDVVHRAQLRQRRARGWGWGRSTGGVGRADVEG